MFTIEKATKLLNICYKEYPILQDLYIEIKEGKEFSCLNGIFENIVTIINKSKEDYFSKYIRNYLIKEFDLDSNNYVFNDFLECFSFLHEIGHIYYSDMNSSNGVYKAYKEKVYNSHYQAFNEYRHIEGENLADSFAVTMLKNQPINIYSIMNEISIDRATEEYNFWNL